MVTGGRPGEVLQTIPYLFHMGEGEEWSMEPMYGEILATYEHV